VQGGRRVRPRDLFLRPRPAARASRGRPPRPAAPQGRRPRGRGRFGHHQRPSAFPDRPPAARLLVRRRRRRLRRGPVAALVVRRRRALAARPPRRGPRPPRVARGWWGARRAPRRLGRARRRARRARARAGCRGGGCDGRGCCRHGPHRRPARRRHARPPRPGPARGPRSVAAARRRFLRPSSSHRPLSRLRHVLGRLPDRRPRRRRGRGLSREGGHFLPDAVPASTPPPPPILTAPFWRAPGAAPRHSSGSGGRGADARARPTTLFCPPIPPPLPSTTPRCTTFPLPSLHTPSFCPVAWSPPCRP